MMPRSFTRCPRCHKIGVQFRFAKVVAGEDGHGCRYCDFWFFASPTDRLDRQLHDDWAAANHHCATCGGFLVGADDAYICESCGDEWPLESIDGTSEPFGPS
ncbi:MAG: hypothetical protein M0007_09375 [Actinomycetota bacterium]|nr:hypothetical protein [Actinomycetota bacterium]